MNGTHDVEERNRTSKRAWRNIRTHLEEDVSESWEDAILIVTCWVTGLLDSAVFNVWSCFVSMQTGKDCSIRIRSVHSVPRRINPGSDNEIGNTVYVGLGVSGQPLSQPYRWAKSLTAIVFFCVGTFLFSRLMRLLGPSRRGTICLSFLLQGVFCYVSAILGATGVVPPDAGNWLPKNNIVLLPLALLAMQSAGQIVMSRFFGYGEVTTVVLTSAYCDLIFDPLVFTAPLRENAKRNRRALSALMLVLGAVAGGFLTREKNITLCLWIAGSIKFAIAIAFAFWKSKDGSIRLE
jgi:hypothetical protein